MEADPDRPGRPRPLGAPPSQLSRLPRRAFLAAALVAGCSRRPSARPGAERVISLSPSTTEAIFAIGAGARLVGRSEHCDYPGAALALPSVGGYASPDLERVIALRPDLVVGEQSPVGPALAERLAEQGIATLFPPTRSLGEIIAMLHLFGQRFAAADGAERITRRIEGQVARVTRWAADRPRRRVVMVFDAQPLFVAGHGSYADELLRLAGGDNPVREGGLWPTIDVERLLALDPDVIIDASMAPSADGRSKLPASPGFEHLRAVREGQVRRLHSDAALRPGPRVGDGLVDLAKLIHGAAPP